jgi:hypothetical protein
MLIIGGRCDKMFEVNQEDLEGIKASGTIKPIPGVGTKPNRGMIEKVPKGHSVLCGYDQGLGERLFVCQSEEDIQELYAGYRRGSALDITWYSGIVVIIMKK